MVDVTMNQEISFVINTPLPVCTGCVMHAGGQKEAVAQVINFINMNKSFCIRISSSLGFGAALADGRRVE